jgi:hypothetical protein
MRKIAMAAAILVALQVTSAAGGCGMTDKPERAFALAGPTVLRTGRTVVPVTMNRGLAQPGAGRPTIVIEGLRFDSPPGVLYELYLQNRSGRRALLGVVNFFNHGAGYGGGDAGAAASTQSFDATEALRALGGRATALVFEPSTGVAGSKGAANPAANVRFTAASIELR